MAKVKGTATKVTRRIESVDLKKYGILGYDFDNLYPQRVTNIVNDSGTLTTALRMYTKFVMGGGAKDEDFAKFKVNKSGLTVNKLIRKIAKSKGKFTGIALHFNYNGLGQKVEVNFIPWEYDRLTLEDSKHPDMIAVYDDWGITKRKKINPKKIDYIHKYDPSKVLEQVEAIEINEKGLSKEAIQAEKWKAYKGQIWYWTPEGDCEYPLAPYDSVLEDAQTEAQTKRFKHSTAATNFLASHMIVTGVEESKDDNGNPLPENQTIGGAIKEFQGGDNAAGILHIERESPDESIEIEKIEIQDYDGLYEYTENSARDSILRPFLIPPILLLKSEGGLGGSGLEREVAKSTYNEITEPDRLIIEEILREAFRGFVGNPNPSNDYSIIPLATLNPIPKDYTEFFDEEEIRASLGYAPRKVVTNPNAQ